MWLLALEPLPGNPPPIIFQAGQVRRFMRFLSPSSNPEASDDSSKSRRSIPGA
jgi:hypothetical protein